VYSDCSVHSMNSKILSEPKKVQKGGRFENGEWPKLQRAKVKLRPQGGQDGSASTVAATTRWIR
jgi:hypothetical protein